MRGAGVFVALALLFCVLYFVKDVVVSEYKRSIGGDNGY